VDDVHLVIHCYVPTTAIRIQSSCGISNDIETKNWTSASDAKDLRKSFRKSHTAPMFTRPTGQLLTLPFSHHCHKMPPPTTLTVMNGKDGCTQNPWRYVELNRPV